MHTLHIVRLDLHKLARETALALDDQRAVCEPVAIDNLVSTKLQVLAMMAKSGQEPEPAATTLQTFFTEDALQLLLRAPNRYWFWKVVEAVVLMELGAQVPLYGKSTVQQAVAVMRAARIRTASLASVYDICSDDNGSRETQICLRTAQGLAVLVPSRDGKSFYLADNPVFFDQSFID